MRVLIIDENYPKYLQSFYIKNNVSGLSYQEHYNLLINDHFATNGAWNAPLAAYDFDITEIYFNNAHLQNHWLTEFEHDPQEFAAYKEFQTVFLQIKYYQPEVLYISNPHYFNKDVISQIKSEFSFIKVFACYLGTPYTTHAISEYNVCFSTLNKYSDEINKLGKIAHRMPTAFNKQIVNKIKLNTADAAYNLCFAGGIVRSNDMHSKRLEYVEYLAENALIEIYSEIYDTTLLDDLKENTKKKLASAMVNGLRKIGISNEFLARLPVIGKATRWDKHDFKLFSPAFKALIKPPLFGMDMYNTFSQNKIVFNIHVDNAGEEAGNMRLFEATGVGACLLTDSKANLSDFFVDGKEIVTYSSKEECLEKAKWLINNPHSCKEIAQAGMKRVLKDHTYNNRASIFSDSIKKALGKTK